MFRRRKPQPVDADELRRLRLAVVTYERRLNTDGTIIDGYRERCSDLERRLAAEETRSARVLRNNRQLARQHQGSEQKALDALAAQALAEIRLEGLRSAYAESQQELAGLREMLKALGPWAHPEPIEVPDVA